MNFQIRKIIVACALLLPAVGLAQDIAVRGERIYTSAGAPIDNGVVIIQDGQIAAVGPASSVSVPSGIQVVEAAVVTPGLVDAHTVVGMVGFLSQRPTLVRNSIDIKAIHQAPSRCTTHTRRISVYAV